MKMELDVKDIDLYHGDCREILKILADDSMDSVVVDPPYHLASIVKRFGKANSAPAQYGTDGVYARSSKGFMGKEWDGGDIAFDPTLWAEVLRVLKPGGYLLSFGGTRTYHRMACAIEDGGFEIRDCISWLYGQGFPKSHNIGKQIDKGAGTKREVVGIQKVPGMAKTNVDQGAQTRTKYEFPKYDKEAITEAAKQWEGWGTALKPAAELIVMARKPLSEHSIAANVLKHGTGGLNIDVSRVGIDPAVDDARLGGNGTWGTEKMAKQVYEGGYAGTRVGSSPLGRWPANVIHDGTEEVTELFPNSKSGVYIGHNRDGTTETGSYSGGWNKDIHDVGFGDSGSAARFFYCAKASSKDRVEGSTHPTVKPLALMRYLVRMVTPPQGTVLDCFAGTGTTGQAALLEGFRAVLVERESEYIPDILKRLNPPVPKSKSESFSMLNSLFE